MPLLHNEKPEIAFINTLKHLQARRIKQSTSFFKKSFSPILRLLFKMNLSKKVLVIEQDSGINGKWILMNGLC